MKIEMIKEIGGKKHDVEILIAPSQRYMGQTTQVAITIKINGEIFSKAGHYNADKKGVMFSSYGSVKEISGVKVGGFAVSAEDAFKLEQHLAVAKEKYNELMDSRISALLSGKEKVKVWRYSNSCMMVTLHDDHNGLDWQKIITEAAKKWLVENFPLVPFYEYDSADLHRGFICANDAAGLPGAEKSLKTYKTMGGEIHPEYVLVPLSSLMQNAAPKYEKISVKTAKENQHRNEKISQAKTSGEKQVLYSYVSENCLDNLDDCSFDQVTVWIDEAGKTSQTHIHCH